MIQQILHEKKQRIEERLRGLLVTEEAAHQKLYEAMNYSLLAGGKRIRPSLFLMVLDVFGVESDWYMDAACAIECVHTYSLIHDDLPQMDNDDYRRGQLTNHRVFGAGMATMAGDGLLTYAFELLAGMEGTDPLMRNRLILLLARAAGPDGMVGGQAQDIEAENQHLSVEALRTMDRCKTGCLLCAPIDMAAVLAGASPAYAERLHQYGMHLGQLFQITDDLLDVSGTMEEMGKQPGQDAVMNKMTYVSLLGVNGAKEMAAQEARAATEALSGLDIDTAPLGELAMYLLHRVK